MIEFEKTKKIVGNTIYFKTDSTNENLYISSKSYKKILGIVIAIFSLALVLKAFSDLIVTNGNGLAPIPFKLSIVLGIFGLLCGWLISNSKKDFTLTINFKERFILLQRKEYNSIEPRKIEILKTDKFEAKEENGLIKVFLHNDKEPIELFSFRNISKENSSNIKEEMVQELNDNIC